jgi:multimeric flavodoxin WrbA
MKTIILNGSPRKNWNTAQLLKEAQGDRRTLQMLLEG